MVINNAAHTRRAFQAAHTIVQQNARRRRCAYNPALYESPTPAGVPGPDSPIVPTLEVVERRVCQVFEDTAGMWSVESEDGVRTPLCFTDDRLKAAHQVAMFIYRSY
jgi:hypothetical protein